MAFVQELQGIKVFPSVALKRSGLFRENINLWPKGYAFGGWIYSADATMGFSKQPTIITLSIVLELKPNLPPAMQPAFDISDNLLANSLTSHGSTSFWDEWNKGHYYKIDLHGTQFQRMYLYDYSISVESGTKTLTVRFKDYSMILDKIYVGLIKRQGPNYGKQSAKKAKQIGLLVEAVADVEVEAFCPNCYLLGEGLGIKNAYGANINSFFSKAKGRVKRNIDQGSFVGLNHKIFSNLPDMTKLPGKNVGFHPDPVLRQTLKDDFSCYQGNAASCQNAFGQAQHPLYAKCVTRVVGQDPQGNDITRTFCPPWKPSVASAPKDNWNYFHNQVEQGKRSPVGFTMDGGYLMLGTEGFAEKNCGQLPDVTYNFSELLNSLIYRGLNFARLPANYPNNGWPDKNPKFRTNYIGTLREVLEQWCGAMALDYFWRDDSFYFIDLEAGADISPLRDIVDPSTSMGVEFGATDVGKSVIVSYKESSTLDNTYLQSVITSNTKPFTKKERSKEVKRHVGILPFHPLDFSTPNWDQTSRYSSLGEVFNYQTLANPMPWDTHRGAAAGGLGKEFENEPAGQRLAQYTDRRLWDIDNAIALSRYDRRLRDMYVGQRVIENCETSFVKFKKDPKTNKVQKPVGKWKNENVVETTAELAALGFELLSEIIDPQVKSMLMETHFGQDEIPDISFDPEHYKIFIGYYNQETHEEIVSWEQRCADGMYKFGAYVEGTLPGEPFIPRDYYGLPDGEAGFGKGNFPNGLSIPKLVNSFTPDAQTYPMFTLETELAGAGTGPQANAPFAGVLFQSGNHLPTGILYTTIDNPWGTTTERFQSEFYKKFQDDACTQFNNSFSVVQSLFPPVGNKEPIEKKQSWNLDQFVPKFVSEQDSFMDDIEPQLKALFDRKALVDEAMVVRDDINNKFKRWCKKVTLLFITNVEEHPNIYFRATQRAPGGNLGINPEAKKQRLLWEINEHKRKQREGLLDMCDHDILFEFCENAMKNDKMAAQAFGNVGLANFAAACAVNPTGIYKEGFAKELIGGYPELNFQGAQVNINKGKTNSRVLNIQLKRNPKDQGDWLPTDDLGYYYVQDLEVDLEPLPKQQWSFDIVYPVNNFSPDKAVNPGGWKDPYKVIVDPNAGMISIPNYQFYSGLWNAQVSVEDRRPELIEIYGAPPCCGPGLFPGNPTSSIKVINSALDPDLEAMLDPDSMSFVTRVIDLDGNELKTVKDHHDYVARGDGGPRSRGLNNYNVIMPTKQIDLKLAGHVFGHMPLFSTWLDQTYPFNGLISMSMSLSDGGLTSDLSFADRPREAPSQEAILNKIGPRIM